MARVGSQSRDRYELAIMTPTVSPSRQYASSTWCSSAPKLISAYAVNSPNTYTVSWRAFGSPNP
jgi:hypothetical protein